MPISIQRTTMWIIICSFLWVNYNRKIIFFFCKWFILAPCDSNPCLNSGICSVVGGSFTCTCPPGYIGSTCEINNRPGKIFENFFFNNLSDYLAACSINCSPGYCFSNLANQPTYACYCTDNTVQLKSCAA